MSNTVVIIPSRLNARRLPNKPLKLINGKEIILHVYDLAKNSRAGDVLVVTPDKDIAELVKKNGGNSFLSTNQHETGTDRVFEAFKDFYLSKPKVIINLQGDMPNLDSNAIMKLKKHMEKDLCDMATLASSIKTKDEIQNRNIVKAITNDNLEKTGFSQALDFKRDLINTKNKFIYHHIGIYAFTSKALLRYVSLKRSKLEIERKLEQLRAMENNISIDVFLANSSPIGVDTKKDYLEIKKLMEYKN